ncbi:MAG: PAS domain-containing sensor histidine kinase [Gallionellales bacterium 35-53-114]|nr:MAG: PAS domain-containing sensor histidine kinase [Gallionellales bacterium 35-53-114]OYZ63558.1 MAG: PAS domain-containing sensor histidine kinase [Gallionellales bacterium 24-53-125]OZB10831.1 MAG: PAS domain-containing sensor histidine kinase [Gallionellales bacterium 39-52-133]HQS58994.1 ATP-binding protein [Gallionellaceae bacterium]HQS75621.1 ATP-binding protein [Gallionellaceae bacterium]
MKYLILISGIIGAVLLYLLSSASANTDLFTRNYYTLLALAGLLAFCLSALVGYQLWQLREKIRAQIFGAKLTLRLALFFSLIAILPGLLVYAVSVQFLGKSIESWFDVRVEKALEGGLNLGRSSLENGLQDLAKRGKFISLLLAEQPAERHANTLKKLIDEGVVQEVAIFNIKGKLLAHVSSTNTTSYQPDDTMLRQAVKQGQFNVVDTLPDNSLVLKVVVPLNQASPLADIRILQLVQPVSNQLADDTETVQSVYRDYQELSLSRLGLKRLYGITLTLSLLIVLLSAVSAAFFLSARLSSPLAALAEGTRAVAQGDFSGNYPVQSRDELGALTGLFNQMTSQLSDAQKLSERQQRLVNKSKAYLESVLTHLSSGVLVVDEQFRLRSANTSAEHILGVSLLELRGVPLLTLSMQYKLLRPFTEAVIKAFAESTENEWQRQIERMSKNGNQMLLLRGTRLSSFEETGYVVVFDDITHLLQAERQAAWGEVARRLAHEIKNPLTPIQLSAERLQYKLSEKLNLEDAKLLQRATQTIVSQVSAMKKMVMEFADYARAPAVQLMPLDMHQLLNEVLGLYEANSSPITLQLNAIYPRINGDATRLRQVIHNLLHNAHDALKNVADPNIVLRTENSQNTLKLSVLDNGSGFPEQIVSRVFEPYMTTKDKGTGLGLPIVKKIVEEHGGSILIEKRVTGGTCISIIFPLLEEEVVG